jgi:mannose-1-phosphate guanylyltransferase
LRFLKLEEIKLNWKNIGYFNDLWKYAPEETSNSSSIQGSTEDTTNPNTPSATTMIVIGVSVGGALLLIGVGIAVVFLIR